MCVEDKACFYVGGNLLASQWAGLVPVSLRRRGFPERPRGVAEPCHVNVPKGEHERELPR